MDVWGKMRLSVTYDAATLEVLIGEDCSANFLPALLVSDICDVISATPGKYSTIHVRHFYHTLRTVILTRKRKAIEGRQCILLQSIACSKNRVVSTNANPAAARATNLSQTPGGNNENSVTT
jgi:cell division protein FtsL